ncbi:SCO1 protein [Decorospora gaudefroyi]|uniref:SCO1 protein n=1 Tax=Decorospora gaudefroyi TaxID=184978 RepID=A0A6A5K5X5_9PLEO|nr:SCO1 protein [Decorospora gaudefroyi]
MSAPSRCIAAAARGFKSIPVARISHRTITSHTSTPAASLRQAIGGNTTCLRALQRAKEESSKNGAGRIRNFTQSASRSKLKTIDQIRARNKGGPFNLTAAILFVAASAGLWAYFRHEKERMARKRIAEQTKGIGKPKVGGPFQLIDQDGRPFSSDDMLGKYALVYFGFSHCPDICPDELDKMALMYDKVVAECGNVLLPIMITCDPARDKPSVLKEYLTEFHPNFIGLTGEYDNIKDTCKAYRVYFSTPNNVKPGQDYLVDHSIYFYLMDPEGDFVEAIGRNFTADQAAKVIRDHIKDWEKPLKKEMRWQ